MARTETANGVRRRVIEEIERQKARDVCFSKRRTGINKKASELTTLAGGEILVVVFSRVGNAYALGCPTPELIINSFISSTILPLRSSPEDRDRAFRIQELNNSYMQLDKQLEVAKKKTKTLDTKLKKMTAENQLCSWAVTNVNSLGFAELLRLTAALEELQIRLPNETPEILTSGAASLLSHAVVPAQVANMLDPFVPRVGEGSSFNAVLPVADVGMSSPFNPNIFASYPPGNMGPGNNRFF